MKVRALICSVAKHHILALEIAVGQVQCHTGKKQGREPG